MARAFWDVLTLPIRRSAVITFAVWTYALFWLAEGKRFTLFLLPNLFPLLIGAALIMLLFFTLNLSQERRKPSPRLLFSCGVLLLPLLFLYSVQNETLGIYAYSRKTFTDPGAISNQVSEEFLANSTLAEKAILPDPTLLQLTQHWPSYQGHEVTTRGQWVRGGEIPEGYGFLFGFAIACCAADAQPLGILVEESKQHATPGRSDWVEVKGMFDVRVIQGKKRLLIHEATIRPIQIPAPQNRYLYFEPELSPNDK